MGDKFEFLKNVNPLTLFDYYGLAAGDASAVGGAIALAVGAVALFAVAVAAFDRRDLSIESSPHEKGRERRSAVPAL